MSSYIKNPKITLSEIKLDILNKKNMSKVIRENDILNLEYISNNNQNDKTIKLKLDYEYNKKKE